MSNMLPSLWELGNGYPTMTDQDGPKIVAVSPSKNGNNWGLVEGLVSYGSHTGGSTPLPLGGDATHLGH